MSTTTPAAAKNIVTNKVSPTPTIQDLPVVPSMPAVLMTTTPAPSTPVVANTSIPTLSSSYLSNTLEDRDALILKRLQLENQQIDDYIQLLQDQRSTDRTRVQYDNGYITFLQKIYKPCIVIYWISLAILAYVLFIEKENYSITVKIFLMIGFFVYPYLIYSIEDVVISWFNFFYSLVFFQPIQNDPIKIATQSQPFLYDQPKSTITD